jgi:hypothetical protein
MRISPAPITIETCRLYNPTKTLLISNQAISVQLRLPALLTHCTTADSLQQKILSFGLKHYLAYLFPLFFSFIKNLKIFDKTVFCIS